MRCFFTFAIAAALAAGWNATSWSQTSSGAGVGAATGTTGESGAAGTAATPGASGNVGAGATVPGASGNTGAAGVAVGAPTGVVGTSGNVGTAGRVGANAAAAGAGANAAAGVNGPVNGNANSFFNGVSQTPFFSDPGARRQLNLNDAQFNSLNQAYRNALTRYNQAVNNIDPNMSPQQRELVMQQLQTQFNQSLTGNVNSTFTSPQSLNRYNQLNRQFNGFNAFNDPVVRRELNLTQDQIRQLRTLSANWRQQMQQFRRTNTSADPSLWTQMQQQYATQLNGVLTPQQQQLWLQQTGQAYAFPSSAYFGNQQAVVPPDDTARDQQIRSKQRFAPTGQRPTTQGTQTPTTTTPSTAQGGTQGTQGGTVR